MYNPVNNLYLLPQLKGRRRRIILKSAFFYVKVFLFLAVIYSISYIAFGVRLKISLHPGPLQFVQTVKRLQEEVSPRGDQPIDNAITVKTPQEKYTIVLNAADFPPCPGLCPPSHWNGTQEAYINRLIDDMLGNGNTKIEPVVIGQNVPLGSKDKAREYLNLVEEEFEILWRPISHIYGPRQFYAPNLNISEIITAFNVSKIRKGEAIPSSDVNGLTMKAIVTLQGGLKTILKPKFYDITRVDNFPKRGLDRHFGEIAFFHLSRLLGLNRVPISIGMNIDLQALRDVADSELLHLIKKNKTKNGTDLFCWQYDLVDAICICKPKFSFCDGNKMPGVVTQWIPQSLEKKGRYPWQNYWPRADGTHEFLHNPLHCHKVVSTEFTNLPHIFLDMMENSILDFIANMVDRHHIEIFANLTPSMQILLDNGKSFTEPEDNTFLLAPIYQCCRIRKSFYDRLRRLAESNLGQSLNEMLKLDPLYPILNEQHLTAVNRRLIKAIALLQLCFEKYNQNIFMEDDLQT